MSGAFSPSLVAIFVFWAAACIGLAAVFLRRAPAVSVSLAGSVVGAIVGFLVGNSDGPAEVPAYTAVGASVGLFVLGVLAPGKGSGFCNYQGDDLLGGWVSGVIVAFLVDAVFVVGLLSVSSWKAKRSASRVSVKEDAPIAQPVLPSR